MGDQLRIEISSLSAGEWRVVERSHHATDTVSRVAFDQVELEELLQEIENCLLDSHIGKETQRSRLYRLGGRLAELTLPPQLKDALALCEKPVEFFLDDCAVRLPIEIIPNGAGVLCESVPVSRHWLCEHDAGQSRVPQRRETSHALIVADPADNLREAKREGESVFRIVRTYGKQWNCRYLGRKVTTAELSRELPNTDLLHLAAHCVSGKNNANNGIDMADGLWTPAQSFSSPNTVFLNCCRAGQLCNEHGSLSLAGRFLRQGTKHIIAPFLPTSDHIAQRFAIEVYTRLATNGSISRAVHEARKALGPPAWCYWHFGTIDDSLQVTAPRPQTSTREMRKILYVTGAIACAAVLLFFFLLLYIQQSAMSVPPVVQNSAASPGAVSRGSHMNDGDLANEENASRAANYRSPTIGTNQRFVDNKDMSTANPPPPAKYLTLNPDKERTSISVIGPDPADDF